MKRHPVPFTYLYEQTMQQLDGDGLLLAATKPGGDSNVMTIGWGTVGTIWGRPIFTVLVRPSRFTYEFIEASGEFTVNVPTKEMHDYVLFCGTKSGRDHDKFVPFQMTTSSGQTVNAVTLDACPLVYECRVVQKNDVSPETFDPSILSKVYRDNEFHRVYYGEITGTFST